jgi:hypothetical protein
MFDIDALLSHKIPFRQAITAADFHPCQKIAMPASRRAAS